MAVSETVAATVAVEGAADSVAAGGAAEAWVAEKAGVWAAVGSADNSGVRLGRCQITGSPCSTPRPAVVSRFGRW